MSAGKIIKALILGAPASGKGTISSRIVKKYGFEHVSSGDRLRWNVKNGTPLGLEVKSYMDSGKLVPDDVMLKFILGELSTVKKNWLLDGFPRTAIQADKFSKKESVDFVVNLVVPFEVIIERAKGRWIHLPSGRVYNTDFNAPKVEGKDDVTGEDLVQRPDDRPKAVLQRLEIYREMTEPVIAFFEKLKIIHSIQGRTSDEIWPKVIQYMDEQLKQISGK